MGLEEYLDNAGVTGGSPGDLCVLPGADRACQDLQIKDQVHPRQQNNLGLHYYCMEVEVL